MSILKANGKFQTNCIVCIKRQSQSQLIVRSAVITSVMSVLLCREMSGELFLSGAGHDSNALSPYWHAFTLAALGSSSSRCGLSPPAEIAWSSQLPRCAPAGYENATLFALSWDVLKR